ncbi:MAG: cytochrome C [Bacteroidota bacterium]
MSNSNISIFIDEEPQPVAVLQTPVQFELNTKKLIDGVHILTIVSKSPMGREGIKKIPFRVRNGPEIITEGIEENEVLDGIVPIMINAYDKGNQKEFIIEGSETPRSIPIWVWVLLISFFGWAAFYTITNFSI